VLELVRRGYLMEFHQDDDAKIAQVLDTLAWRPASIVGVTPLGPAFDLTGLQTLGKSDSCQWMSCLFDHLISGRQDRGRRRDAETLGGPDIDDHHEFSSAFEREVPTASRHDKGQPIDVSRIGRELGVRYVFEGSVRWVANRVRNQRQAHRGGASRSYLRWAGRICRAIFASREPDSAVMWPRGRDFSEGPLPSCWREISGEKSNAKRGLPPSNWVWSRPLCGSESVSLPDHGRKSC